MPDAMTATNPLVTTAPPALDATAQADTTHTPTQVHRTIVENGQPTYFQDADDPRPELASELAAEGAPTAVSATGATELSPVQLHHVFGGDGEPPYYVNADGVTPQILRSQPVGQPRPDTAMPSDRDDAAQLIAALVTAALWEVIGQAGGPRVNSGTHTLARRVFDPEWLAALALPSRENIPEHQLVTLADGTFTRYPDTASMLADYERVPRTWIFERAQRVIPWLDLTTDYLGRLSASPLEVLAAVFDSRTGEKAPMLHCDEWHSVIVQFDGAKQWTIGAGPAQQQLTTEPGDVLLLPEGLAHAASTPDDPGYSRHVTLGVCRHTEYTRAETAAVRPPR
jgi:hypothetical protein